jgi:hypothetical protein
VVVAARAGIAIGGLVDPGVSKTDIAAFAGSDPVPVIVRKANGSTVVWSSEVIPKAADVAVIVTLAEPDCVVSWALVAVTVTGLVLGIELGAV